MNYLTEGPADPKAEEIAKALQAEYFVRRSLDGSLWLQTPTGYLCITEVTAAEFDEVWPYKDGEAL